MRERGRLTREPPSAQRDERPASASARHPLLGGRTAAAFLAHYWQKRALRVRGAVSAIAATVSRETLFALAARDDIESRLVRRTRGHYILEHGPFRSAALERLPSRNWTLLVQGVNLATDAADALLRRFAFIPYARLDDLMVSARITIPTTYSCSRPPGGGAGATDASATCRSSPTCRSASCDTSRRPTIRRSTRATCCTCLPAMRMTASPSTHA
jgi:hypothetical protein